MLPMNRLAGLLLSCGVALAVRIDFAQLGRQFEGLGALSGGGGTSRLLYDYPEPQRAQVLDALFVSGRLQLLKVEIGGDAQSTEATEPSHMHTRDDLNFERGYEWWLMKEAKKRNPDIKLSALSWGAPGWVGGGSYFSEDNIDYHIKWLQGAQRVHGLDMDMMGVWNEHSASTDWIVQLRRAMDSAGFGAVRIVATDEGGWPICDAMMQNVTVRAAVDVLGSHYPVHGAWTGQGRKFPQAGPAPASCQALNEQYGKSLWTSEGWNLAYVNDWEGALNLASTINRNYVLQNQTAMVVWNLVYAWYSILPFARPVAGSVAGLGHGLISAGEPWSGHYSIDPPLYAMMHTTQFVEPGCRYIENAAVAGGGWLDPANKSSIVAYRCQKAAESWIALVVETSELSQPLNQTVLTFEGLEPPFVPHALRQFRTCEGGLFTQLPDVVVVGSPSAVTVSFLPGCVYTLVSADTQRGAALPDLSIPPSKSFPDQWSDNFDSYTDQQTVKYFADEAGSFNAAKSPTGEPGMVLEQAVPQHPIDGRWWGNSQPYSLLGNSQNWTNTTVSSAVLVLAPGAASPGSNISSSFARVCARISGFRPDGEPPQGYCLIIDANGKWFLTQGGKRGQGWSEAIQVAISGDMPTSSAPFVGNWHTVQLEVAGNVLTGTVDGTLVGSYVDETSRFTHGMVGIGSGWHLAYFDNFTVTAKSS